MHNINVKIFFHYQHLWQTTRINCWVQKFFRKHIFPHLNVRKNISFFGPDIDWTLIIR